MIPGADTGAWEGLHGPLNGTVTWNREMIPGADAGAWEGLRGPLSGTVR